VKTHGFANPPPDPIADHGLADGAGDGEADFWPVGLLFADTKSREVRAGIA